VIGICCRPMTRAARPLYPAVSCALCRTPHLRKRCRNTRCTLAIFIPMSLKTFRFPAFIACNLSPCTERAIQIYHQVIQIYHQFIKTYHQVAEPEFAVHLSWLIWRRVSRARSCLQQLRRGGHKCCHQETGSSRSAR
jgi:hypothetical protein